METVSVTAQTRAQIERAQRAAEEARKRVQASRGGALRLPPAEEGETRPGRADGFLQYFSGD
jgi:hypothetical protein